MSVSPVPGAIEVVWDVEIGPCMLASATAKRAGSIVQIEIEQHGNPLANCVAGRYAYRHVARATGIVPGTYQLRLIDVRIGVPAVHVGRGTVAVLP